VERHDHLGRNVASDADFGGKRKATQWADDSGEQIRGPIKVFASRTVAEAFLPAQLDEGYIRGLLEDTIRSMAWFGA